MRNKLFSYLAPSYGLASVKVRLKRGSFPYFGALFQYLPVLAVEKGTSQNFLFCNAPFFKLVRVFLQYLQRNSVISMVCWHDSGDVYYKTENETSQNGPKMSCCRSRLVCCLGAKLVCPHGRDCDALETGNPRVEYRDTTPLKTHTVNRWYQRAKMGLTYHIESWDEGRLIEIAADTLTGPLSTKGACGP